MSAGLQRRSRIQFHQYHLEAVMLSIARYRCVATAVLLVSLSRLQGLDNPQAPQRVPKATAPAETEQSLAKARAELAKAEAALSKMDPRLKKLIDPEATVTGSQHATRVDLVATTSLPGSILKHRLRLLAGNGWELRDVTRA